MDYTIRKATVDDLEYLNHCATAFYSESVHLKDFSMPKFIDFWSRAINAQPERAVIYILVAGNLIVGTLGGVAFPDIYNDNLIASELFWYVMPNFRGVGLELYREFEKWARSKDCKCMRMGALADVDKGARLDKFYERIGFHRVEVQYSKELTCAG